MTSIPVDSGRRVMLDDCPITETEDSFCVQEIRDEELHVHVIPKTSDTARVIAGYMEAKQ